MTCGETVAAQDWEATSKRTLVGTKLTPLQRVRMGVIAALFALSLALGIATSTRGVEAKMVCYQDPGRGMVCTRIP
jgi:hypothetical protein